MLPALRPLVIDAFLIVLTISVLDEFIPARLAEQEPLGTAISLVEAASAGADFDRHPSVHHS